jgi:hypothetical protein
MLSPSLVRTEYAPPDATDFTQPPSGSPATDPAPSTTFFSPDESYGIPGSGTAVVEVLSDGTDVVVLVEVLEDEVEDVELEDEVEDVELEDVVLDDDVDDEDVVDDEDDEDVDVDVDDEVVVTATPAEV